MFAYFLYSGIIESLVNRMLFLGDVQKIFAGLEKTNFAAVFRQNLFH